MPLPLLPPVERPLLALLLLLAALLLPLLRLALLPLRLPQSAGALVPSSVKTVGAHLPASGDHAAAQTATRLLLRLPQSAEPSPRGVGPLQRPGRKLFRHSRGAALRCWRRRVGPDLCYLRL